MELQQTKKIRERPKKGEGHYQRKKFLFIRGKRSEHG
jgi:hypothetical protein